MTPHDAILVDYEQALPALRAHGESLAGELRTWLARDPSLKIHSVTVRLKTRESLAEKLARPDRSYSSLWDVTDLVGLRVITYFEDAVERVGQLLEARLKVRFEHSIDKRRRADAAAFGYRSLHYVCSLSAHAQGSTAPPPGLHEAACCEVQVRTVLEHAWAEIEHDLGYKARDAVPADVRRRLHRVAGLLELADQEFLGIRRDIEAYAASLPSRIEADASSIALDGISLAPLLACDEVQDLDQRVAGALGRELGDDPFFPEYLLKMLASSGVRTVAEARDGIRAHGERILRMVRPYFAFAWEAWRLAPGEMDRIYRGYSLFFLAHVLVLRSPALGIDKVERLARLYRELDYPDDERAAQRVASTLVDAFGE